MNIDRGIADEALARARQPREVACWSRTRLPARLIAEGWHVSLHGERCVVTYTERFHDERRQSGYVVRVNGESVVNGRCHAANFDAQTQTTVWRPLYPGDRARTTTEAFAISFEGTIDAPQRGMIDLVDDDGYTIASWRVADGDDPSRDLEPA